ncbi:MAG TPA: DNA-3-methyladenine glycosylase [Terriglobia bacterium]|nr:DNA-3-methyladenine glycosylase [Terriglobia bacterium]
MTRPTPRPERLRRLRRAELPVDTVELARYLIGKSVVRELEGARLTGRIVEAEAYPIGDPAAHHFRGPTPRNRSLFLEPGHAYVYLAYGTSYMLNVSSEEAGVGGGVLLRAIEPRDGIEPMMRHRRTRRVEDLTRGPGRLAEALAITPRLDGIDLCAAGPLWLATAAEPPRPIGPIGPSGGIARVGTSVRIGLTRAARRRLRFYERGNRFVSGPRLLRA